MTLQKTILSDTMEPVKKDMPKRTGPGPRASWKRTVVSWLCSIATVSIFSSCSPMGELPRDVRRELRETHCSDHDQLSCRLRRLGEMIYYAEDNPHFGREDVTLDTILTSVSILQTHARIQGSDSEDTRVAALDGLRYVLGRPWRCDTQIGLDLVEEIKDIALHDDSSEVRSAAVRVLRGSNRTGEVGERAYESYCEVAMRALENEQYCQTVIGVVAGRLSWDRSDTGDRHDAARMLFDAAEDENIDPDLRERIVRAFERQLDDDDTPNIPFYLYVLSEEYPELFDTDFLIRIGTRVLSRGENYDNYVAGHVTDCNIADPIHHYNYVHPSRMENFIPRLLTVYDDETTTPTQRESIIDAFVHGGVGIVSILDSPRTDDRLRRYAVLRLGEIPPCGCNYQGVPVSLISIYSHERTSPELRTSVLDNLENSFNTGDARAREDIVDRLGWMYALPDHPPIDPSHTERIFDIFERAATQQDAIAYMALYHAARICREVPDFDIQQRAMNLFELYIHDISTEKREGAVRGLGMIGSILMRNAMNDNGSVANERYFLLLRRAESLLVTAAGDRDEWIRRNARYGLYFMTRHTNIQPEMRIRILEELGITGDERLIRPDNTFSIPFLTHDSGNCETE
ncbi:hypothetical protein KKF81_05360 [Candidatus Micrarchaeota archaeon]|nr:hypothetical protein [Candidatus Micrarchaeota archaeon]